VELFGLSRYFLVGSHCINHTVIFHITKELSQNLKLRLFAQDVTISKATESLVNKLVQTTKPAMQQEVGVVGQVLMEREKLRNNKHI
jgi:hypothetical protein